GVDNPIVQQVLGSAAPEQLAARMIDATTLGDPVARRALWDGGLDAVNRSTDPFIRLALALDPAARALRKQMEQEVESVVQKNAELIAQARFLQQGTTAYPDATFTLRLSYGQVAGWEEAGKAVAPFTTIDGAFARHTGAEPFALPASWLNARSRLNPAQAMNLVSTNDIIGGNSGSPMVNRRGEVVGLIFDGNIHSLGGAFGYDKSSNRAVAVDSGMLLEAMNKIYGAGVLADEITAASAGVAAQSH
ncbi:MAG: S46 family peptidase, partial [Pseudomonadota bacterium]|nr:S46 family peptidase [Pseudomonadota bacterium]